MTAYDRPRFLAPAEARARLRALDAGLDFMAEQVAPLLWSVPSISHAHERHLVRQDRHSGRWTCDCEAAAHQLAYCAHRAAVALVLERES